LILSSTFEEYIEYFDTFYIKIQNFNTELFCSICDHNED